MDLANEIYINHPDTVKRILEDAFIVAIQCSMAPLLASGGNGALLLGWQ
jgi:hypothetical protein